MSPTATTFTTSSPETHPSKHVSLAQAKTVALQKELKEERSKAEELQTECDRLRKFKDVFWLRAMNLDYGIRTLFSALNLPLGLLFRSYHYDCHGPNQRACATIKKPYERKERAVYIEY